MWSPLIRQIKGLLSFSPFHSLNEPIMSYNNNITLDVLSDIPKVYEQDS